MDRTARTRVRRIAAVALAVALVLALAGCAARNGLTGGGVGETSSSDGYGYRSGAPDIGSAPTAPGYEGDNAAAEDQAKGGGTGSARTAEKLIVINKTIRIETADVEKAIDSIRDLAARDGGDIANMQVSTSNDEPIYPQPVDKSGAYSTDYSTQLRAFVTVRVPNAKFNGFVADVAKLGKVLFQAQNTDDVTQQHIDMRARLDNMKAEQARLRELFDRATKVSDLLAIEQELSRVQGEIESMQAQIAYLEDQAALATVTIELKEPTPVVSPTGTDWGVQRALTNAVRAFVETMNAIIVLLGPIVAILLFLALPIFLIVRLVRRFLRARRAKRDATAGSSDETA